MRDDEALVILLHERVRDEVPVEALAHGAVRADGMAMLRARTFSDLFRDGDLETHPVGLESPDLVVHGRLVRCSARRGESPDDVSDRAVADALPDLLVRSVKRSFKGPRVTIEWVDDAVVVSSQDEPLLTIRASYGIHLASGSRVSGNFLAGGDHWQELLHADRRPIRVQFPDGVDERLAEDAVRASRKIFAERSVAYGVPVLLSQIGSEIALRIEPVQRLHGQLQIPFTVAGPGFALEGGILLAVDTHPLPLMEGRLVGASEDLGFAWALVLLGIAELTCPDLSALHAKSPRAQSARGFSTFYSPPTRQLEHRRFGQGSSLRHGAALANG